MDIYIDISCIKFKLGLYNDSTNVKTIMIIHCGNDGRNKKKKTVLSFIF